MLRFHSQFFKWKFSNAMLTSAAVIQSSVSIVTIVIRRRFFSKKLQSVMGHRGHSEGQQEAGKSQADVAASGSERKTSKKKKHQPLTADMVRRVDVPVLVNQMNGNGWLREAEHMRSDVKPVTIISNELTGSPDEMSLSSARKG